MAKIVVVGGPDTRHRVPFARSLVRKGWDVTVVTSSMDGLSDTSEFQVREYDLARQISPFGDLKSLYQLYRICKDLCPEVVQTFDTKPGIYGIIGAKLAGVPVRVRTLTGLGQFFTGARSPVLRSIFETLLRAASSAASRTVLQNPDDMQVLVRKRLVSEDKARVILGSGVESEAWKTRTGRIDRAAVRSELGFQDEFIVLFAARMLWSKGVGELLEAAKALLVKRPGIRFVLAGPREEGRDSVPDSTLMQLPDNVTYLGERSDLENLYAAADVFVLPTSFPEGIPRVLMEAGAIGLPLIATDTPGCREVVVSGAGGYLIEPGSPAELEGAIAKVSDLTNDERARLGAFNQNHIRETLDLERVVEGYVDLYGTS